MPVRLVSSNPSLPASPKCRTVAQGRTSACCQNLGPPFDVPASDPVPIMEAERSTVLIAILGLDPELIRAIHNEELLAKFT